MNQGFNAGDQIIRWEYDSFLVDVRGNVWAVPDGTSRTIFHGLIDVILLPADQQTVTVSGTRPYDNAPGGWRASMAQMDSTQAPYGDIIALHQRHDFIPTVSALGLDTQDLFYDIAGDPDLLASTPFDAGYFPQANQEHVLVTPENAAWVVAEVGSGRTAAADVRLAAYDASGRRVAVILERRLGAGEHQARRDGTRGRGARLGSGAYFLRLEAREFAASAKMILT